MYTFVIDRMYLEIWNFKKETGINCPYLRAAMTKIISKLTAPMQTRKICMTVRASLKNWAVKLEFCNFCGRFCGILGKFLFVELEKRFV